MARTRTRCADRLRFHIKANQVQLRTTPLMRSPSSRHFSPPMSTTLSLYPSFTFSLASPRTLIYPDSRHTPFRRFSLP